MVVRYKSWCANYILNILCCQRKRKQNHIDYEAANTFKSIVGFFLLNRGRIEVQFKICGVNGISVYTHKSWSESKLLKWWFGLFFFVVISFWVREIITFVKEMRNSESLKQMRHFRSPSLSPSISLQSTLQLKCCRRICCMQCAHDSSSAHVISNMHQNHLVVFRHAIVVSCFWANEAFFSFARALFC